MRITVDHNLSPAELVDSLAGIAHAEAIAEPLAKALHGHAREPVRERYLVEMMAAFADAGQRLDALLCVNVLRWLNHTPDLAKARKPSQGERILGQRPRSALSTPKKPLHLSQADIEELLALIAAHYRIGIATGISTAWSISPALEASWKDRGIVLPQTTLAGLIQDAFIAGRLAQVLEDGYSLAEMRHLAHEFPVPRSASLAMQAVQEQVGFDLSGGVGYRAMQTAGKLILGENAQRVQDIVAAYRGADLTTSPTNRSDAPPEVVDVASSGRAVQGWQALGRELRNRMASTDRARDWERVAVSSLRMTANCGALGAMEEEGVTHMYFDVHKDACPHCKKLYLLPSGQPHIFLLSELLANVAATGGTNAGRSASTIGDMDSGWLPNALAHPWCQCRPKRVTTG